MTLTIPAAVTAACERTPDGFDRRSSSLAHLNVQRPTPSDLPRSHFSERRFESHVRIDLGRDPHGQLTEILDGTVLLVRIMPDGRRQVLEILGPGALIGVDPGERHAVFVETRTRVRIRIHAADECAAGPVRERYNAQVNARLAALHELTLSMGRRTAAERIATYLVELAGLSAARNSGAIPRARVVPMPLSQADIADHLGLRAETVCRVLAKMKRDRVIALPGHTRLEVLDPAALWRCAGQPLPSPAIRDKVMDVSLRA